MAEQILAMMVFRILGETIGSLSLTKFHGIIEVGKNCFYRLLARSEMNWRILQLSMARRFQSIVRKENAEETEAPKCYIVNDTTVAKTGLHFEGLSRVFDHVLSKCILGYKLLLLAFFDRCSTYAVDLSMHREAGKKGGFSLSKKERSMQFHKERSESNPDYEHVVCEASIGLRYKEDSRWSDTCRRPSCHGKGQVYTGDHQESA